MNYFSTSAPDQPGLISPPPPLINNTGGWIANSSPQPTDPRRYDLDGLRGFAMLLGVLLHAAVPFIPYWEEGDLGGGSLSGLFEFIHGFRMPLFFILSGYFTTMLWRRRGLRALINHRLRRVGLPLLIALFTITPALWFGWGFGWAIYEASIPEKAEVRVEKIGDSYDQQLNQGNETTGKQSDTDDLAKRKPTDADNKETEDELNLAHMWFLWFLIWLVAGFSILAGLIKWIAVKLRRVQPVPNWIVTLAIVTLPFFAVLFQVLMTEKIFGPDTSIKFQPDLVVLGYYGCFFGFGALAYDRKKQNGQALIDWVGKGWAIQLLLASVVLFPLGRILIGDAWFLSSILQVAFAWLMSFGLIGLFLRYLSTPRFAIRWLSDASYWMYLMHLPLIFLAQGIASHSPLTAFINFLLIGIAATSLTLISYRYIIRYTFVGSLLNGARTKVQDDALRLELGLGRPPKI